MSDPLCDVVYEKLSSISAHRTKDNDDYFASPNALCAASWSIEVLPETDGRHRISFDACHVTFDDLDALARIFDTKRINFSHKRDCSSCDLTIQILGARIEGS